MSIYIMFCKEIAVIVIITIIVSYYPVVWYTANAIGQFDITVAMCSNYEIVTLEKEL